MQNSGKKKKTTLGTKDKNERMEGRSRKVLQNGTNRTGNSDKKNLAAGKDKKKNKIQQRKGQETCPYAKKCGGCTYQGIVYEEQLKEKQQLVNKLLKPFCKVHPIKGMEEPYHYRNKVHAVFHKEKNGAVISGVYEAGSHRVVKVESCKIEDEKADAIILSIRDLMKSFKIQPYNEDTGYGLLRHVLIRVGKHSGQIMVVLVLGSPILPSKNNFVKALLKLHPEITTIVLNVNNKKTSMVLGEKETVLYGKGYIEDTLCDSVFRISSKSFYQINVTQTEKLYEKAIELAALTGKERVIDAYCGIGTIGIIASKKAGEVIGVELNKDAVKDAIYNAKRNQVKNIRFYANDAGKFMVGMAQSGEKADVVFMDPPRAGSTEEFMSSVITLNPKRVVYVSCNPETQARDLKYMVKHGYKVEEAWPFDLFPWTEHVETVVLLSQQKPDDYIEVDLELDELDITSAETKATYREIQQYVMKQTGMMVSNLNIAQVRRKCGLDMRENYNLPKSEDAKQPKCPEKKEKAIREALEYFGMVNHSNCY